MTGMATRVVTVKRERKPERAMRGQGGGENHRRSIQPNCVSASRRRGVARSLRIVSRLHRRRRRRRHLPAAAAAGRPAVRLLSG